MVLRRAKYLVGGIVCLLLLGAVVVLILRRVHATALEASTAVHAQRYVTTTTPQAGSSGAPLTLPGTLLGVTESTIYARSNGYILRWAKDIGAAVKKGDLLAEISAPEVDQELSQAEASRAQAASSASLTKSTADRWESLRKKDAVTQQDLDERQSLYQQAESNLAAAQANVERLRKLQEFNHVLAPFDGVVTRRDIDVGDLVNAGNGGTGQAQVYDIGSILLSTAGVLTFTANTSTVPLPPAVWLLGSGLLGLAGVGRRRSAKV